MSVHIIRAAVADHRSEPVRFAVPVPDRDASGGERHEVFEVPRPLPVTPLLELAVVEAETGPEDVARVIGQGRLLRGLLGEDQWPRFVQATAEARWGYMELGEVLAFVLADATGRPTEPSAGSHSSQTDSGHGSTISADASGTHQPPPYQPTS